MSKLTGVSEGTRYNIPLLEKVREQIADESAHDQSLWARIHRSVLNAIPDRWTDDKGNRFVEVSCPTAACVAGWAVSFSGAKMVVPEEYLGGKFGSVEVTTCIAGGEETSISNYAREQLGLSLNEAEALFAAEWTNEEVLENLDDIIRAAKHGMEWKIQWAADREEDADYY